MSQRRFVTIEVRATEQRDILFAKPTELTWRVEFIVVPVAGRDTLLDQVAAAVERAANAFPVEEKPE